MTDEALTPAPNGAPLIGVGVVIRRRGRVLLGQRLGGRESGSFAPPGGLVEAGENLAAAALREVREETGLQIRLTDLAATPREDVVGERVIVSHFVVADWVSGEAQLLEPDKCRHWRWEDWEALPQPLYSPFAAALAAGFSPFAAASLPSTPHTLTFR